MPTATEMRSGPCQWANSGLAQLGELSAANEPSRAMVRLMPKAKLSSLPLNQRAMAQVTATMSDSAPRPKTRRPAAIVTRSPLAAVSAAPALHSTAKIKVARRTPIRSISRPPSSTMNTFGTL